MKKQIRRNVFETNSSSVHSLVISDDGLEPSKLEVNRSGVIHVSPRYFGKEFETYDTQYDKLSYLMTLCCYCANFDKDELYENYNFRYIQDAVCNYSGAKRIIVDHIDNAELDHQSVPWNNEIEIINVWDEKSIINFVFNKYALLQTSCD